MKVKMTKDRDTKGTYVYKAEDDSKESPIRSLYITKSAVSGEAPAEITVEIKEIKEAK